MHLIAVVAVVACVVATVMADLRWLRVAQREHYLAGSVSRFVNRWWYGSWKNGLLWTVAFIGIAFSLVLPEAALAVGIAIAIGPIGLSVKGRTSPLAWTRRMKTLAAVVGAIQVSLLTVGALLSAASLAAALIAALTPTIIDFALALTGPWERRKAQVFVGQASKRLAEVAPTVVAITGSYGKTSTKGYVAHFLAGTKSVMATPASFNNRAGLSRAINEHLSPGTDVFIAEMGTYGFGEIAELCELCPPDIAMITAIGPVHLERFGSEAAIVKAKSEIFEKARVGVLNVDDDRLARVADELEAEGKLVWRCSAADENADVHVAVAGGAIEVRKAGELIAQGTAPDAPGTNVACAVAVALELGVPETEIEARLPSLPVAAHRQEVTRTPDGLVVIDDTYNANPASVLRGLDLLSRSAPGDGHRRVVATPGMVELGRRQAFENERFAAAAAGVATDLVVIGRTNRRALLAGAHGTGLNVVTVDRLPQAVAWVRQHVGEGDAVLYANDLPDHFA